MKTDISQEMFEKYMKYDDDRVRIQFSDGKILTGILTGHYHGNPDSDEFHITHWDFVPCESHEEREKCRETKKHEKISQKDVVAVYFYCDKSILNKL